MTKSISYMKLVMSLGMIVFVAALVMGATGAFFNDTETSTGNTFTAGALDLTVDSVGHVNGLVCFADAWHPETIVEWNPETEALQLIGDPDVGAAVDAYNAEFPANVPQAGDPCESTWALTDLGAQTFFNFADLKPGDEGENTISLHVENNDAYACVIIDNMVDADNDCTEPEADADGELCTVDTPEEGTGGELSQELRFFAWDDDGDNIWEDGEQVLFSNTEGPASDVIDGVVYPLYTPLTGPLAGAATHYVGLYWCYGAITVDANANTLACDGAEVTNLTQTDSLMADFTFYIEQARNNEGFECPVLDNGGPTTAALTVDKIVSFSDQDIAGVDVTDFELHINGPDGDMIVTDEVPATGLTPGTYTISEVYSGDPAGVIYDAQFSGSCADDGDTGSIELVAGDDSTCTLTNIVSEDV